MGADLTIEKTGRYFRDGYGGLNSWSLRGMSYWNTSDEMKHYVRNGVMSANGCKFILAKLKASKFPSYARFVNMVEHHEESYDAQQIANMKRDSIMYDLHRDKYVWAVERDAEMIAFWEEAVKNNSGVIWSV